MNLIDNYISMSPELKILVIIILAIVAGYLVKIIKNLSKKLFTLRIGEKGTDEDKIIKRYPKFASLTTIFVSAVTFIIYFLAAGLVLKQFNVSLGTYLASASIIGLALAFGSQGFVQDVVTGLTLIFSDALNIEDMVEISGQIGRVESIGLRFTTLVNLQEQKIFIPNRSIGMINRYVEGKSSVYVDIQLPDDDNENKITREIEFIIDGVFSQFHHIIILKPKISAVFNMPENTWKFVRIEFTIYPGQNPLIDTIFRQRVISMIKKVYPDYADWMVTIHL